MDSSLLTKLPAELRIKIYEHVATTHIRRSLRVNPRGHIIEPSLAFTCHGIRDELLPVLLESSRNASAIEAIVLDFDFKPLQQLLQSHAERANSRPSPLITITLKFNKSGRSSHESTLIKRLIHWVHYWDSRNLVERMQHGHTACYVVDSRLASQRDRVEIIKGCGYVVEDNAFKETKSVPRGDIMVVRKIANALLEVGVRGGVFGKATLVQARRAKPGGGAER